MKTKYQPVLFDDDGSVIATLQPFELKKDAEAALSEWDFAHAEIKTIYVKGGEAVGR